MHSILLLYNFSKRSIYITLLFTSDNLTNHYKPRTFKDRFKPNTPPIKDPSQLSEVLPLPTRDELKSTRREELRNVFDNEATNPNEDFEDFDLQEDDSIQKYYAVAEGRPTGVFVD